MLLLITRSTLLVLVVLPWFAGVHALTPSGVGRDSTIRASNSRQRSPGGWQHPYFNPDNGLLSLSSPSKGSRWKGRSNKCCNFRFRFMISSLLRMSIENSDEDNSFSSSTNAASVGDYVRNVHGGKYQFHDVAAVGFGTSLVGQEFAQSLYASSSSSDYHEENYEQELLSGELPKWVQRMGSNMQESLRQSEGNYLAVPPTTGESVSISIRNDERTWEEFFVKFIPVPLDGATIATTTIMPPVAAVPPFQATPMAGKLAPRGGASNLCNPQCPYPDSATIRIRRRAAHGGGAEGTTSVTGNWLLVVGTEGEKWYYRLS